MTQGGQSLPLPRGGADDRHLPARPDDRGRHGRGGRAGGRRSGQRTLRRARRARLPAAPPEDRHAAANRRALDRLRADDASAGQSDAALVQPGGGAGRDRRRLCATPLAIYPQTGQTDWRAQMCCYLIHTNETAHEQIRANIDRAPMYDGTIQGVGPRYCPSIEDKVVRFPQKNAHQLFLEPEGWRTSEVYVQGANTSLPHDVQWAMLRAIPALRDVAITRFGYAVEYDAVDVGELTPTLEAKRVQRPLLRRAGQRHQRLRGGGGAGAAGRDQRRAARGGRGPGHPAARSGLPRRDDRRSGDAGVRRAIPDADLARRIPPAAARRQRRPAPDAAGLRVWGWSRGRGTSGCVAKEVGRDTVLAALAATRLTDSGATQAALAAAGLAAAQRGDVGARSAAPPARRVGAGRGVPGGARPASRAARLLGRAGRRSPSR